MGLGCGARVWRWFRAPVEGMAARRRGAGVLCVIGLAAIAAGCSSRPYGSLIVGSTAPNANQSLTYGQLTRGEKLVTTVSVAAPLTQTVAMSVPSASRSSA